MLVVSNLFFEYADRPLLTDVSFIVRPRELLHLKGTNGAGKSTLLKLLASLLQPLSGEILFEGIALRDCLTHYRAQLCYLGHVEGIHPLLTPRDIWAFEVMHTVDTPSLEVVLEMLQLEDLLDTPFALLSAGQKKRVGMMRLAMKKQAKVWLLDEPWAALDSAGIEQLLGLICGHLEAGGVVVTTAHQSLPEVPFLMREYHL